MYTGNQFICLTLPRFGENDLWAIKFSNIHQTGTSIQTHFIGIQSQEILIYIPQGNKIYIVFKHKDGLILCADVSVNYEYPTIS